MDKETEKKYIEAGKIASSVILYAKKIVKPETLALEIAEKIENEILKLNGRIAFPVDVSCNDVAAHYSPFWQDKTLANGLVKVDFGVAIDGYIVDSAISIDLSAEQKYKQLIKAAEDALETAIKLVQNKKNIATREIGKEIHSVITASGFSPIRNLSGHELQQYKLHTGLTIPNYDNGNETVLQEGVYAIEPFATAGTGLVQEGKPSGIYQLEEKKAVRDTETRKLLQFIETEYKTLPFSERWLVKKFGSRVLWSLQMLEQQKCLHQFPQLIEKSHREVSQAENTLLITKEKAIVLCKED